MAPDSNMVTRPAIGPLIVGDAGYPPVRVYRQVPVFLLLLVLERHGMHLIGQSGFLQHDGRLAAIGSGFAIKGNHGAIRQLLEIFNRRYSMSPQPARIAQYSQAR